MKECTSKNPVNVTLKVIGGKWKALLIWHIADGPKRFNQLAREMEGITQRMLTKQLRELEKDGLIKRKVFPVVPPKVEYSISDYGKTLKPVLNAMTNWGNNHKLVSKS